MTTRSGQGREDGDERVYLWLTCEGWVRFGPFDWVSLRTDDWTYLNEKGEGIARWEQGGWRALGRRAEGYGKARFRNPVVTATRTHPDRYCGAIPVKRE